MSRALSAWFSERLGAPATVTGLKRHAEGFSWQTYTMTVTWQDDAGTVCRHGYAVRREPEDGVLAPYDIERQFRLHETLEATRAVPIPPVHWLELDRSVLGMPFYVMDRIEGVVPTPDDEQPFGADERHSIGAQFVDILADLHAVPWRGTVDHLLPVADSPESAAAGQVDQWERFYAESIPLDVPLIRVAIAWLRRNIAVSDRLVICHGDYRNGNFMLRDGRIVGIFDWELTHVSDPVEDLGWTTMSAFGGRSGLVGHLLPEDEFLARYTQRSGLEVQPDALAFWRVLGMVKTLAIFLRGTRAFEDRKTADLRLAAMGHRSLYVLQQLVRQLGIGGVT